MNTLDIMKLISKLLLPLVLTEYTFAHTVVYGVENLDKLNDSVNKPFYVQMGSFTTSANAIRYQHQLKMKTQAKIFIRHHSGRYQVRIGPFNDFASLKKMAQNFSQDQSFQHQAIVIKPNKTTYQSKTQSLALEDKTLGVHHASNWYVSIQAGARKPTSPSSTTVNNGSGFTPPYNQDIYTANSGHANALIGIQTGYRWILERDWISALTLGANYTYFFNSAVNGQVIQFSLPQFTNYNYTWKTASNLFIANSKLNFINFHQFSPYVTGGIGASFNHCRYSEAALVGVTPRISPNYTDKSSSQFAYILGAGIDYQINPQFIMSAGYQYSDLGALGSSYGTLTWTNEQLNFGRNQSNAVLLGMTYLFDKNTYILDQK